VIPEHRGEGALVLLANLVSPVAVDLHEESILRHWSEQASRKIWLARPGDVLVLPVPLTTAFRHYALRLLAVPDDSVTVITVPHIPGVPTAETVAAHGQLEPLRALVRERPGARLLPTALDDASVALATELGVGIALYGGVGPGPSVMRVVAELNTKTGFRDLAVRLGMRLPQGMACTGRDVDRTIDDLFSAHERVVVKSDRSAGGHGMHFLTRGAPRTSTFGAPDTLWVVEEYVEHTLAVSAQGHSAREDATVLYDGEMRMAGGSFIGYRSPPADLPDAARAELTDWTLALGRHLSAEGYRGPYSLDAVCTPDGTLYALECNVRRTATSTAQAMVTRLVGDEHPPSAWTMGTVHTGSAMTFDSVKARLSGAGLEYGPRPGEGVVVYTDHPTNGTGWRYVALAPDRPGVEDLENRLTTALTG